MRAAAVDRETRPQPLSRPSRGTNPSLSNALQPDPEPLELLEVKATQSIRQGSTHKAVHTMLGTIKNGMLRVPLTKRSRIESEEEMYWRKLHQHQARFMSKQQQTREDDKDDSQTKDTYQVHLTDINNSQFVGEINVGTPGQPFNVIFDTGSSNLWINGVACEDEACLKHRRFDPKQSSSFTLLDMDMDVMFGTGQISGSLATDTFVLADSMTVTKQTFGMINSEKGDVFNTGAFDGILGLSFPALSAASYTPVFDNIMAQKLLNENCFSFFYSRLPVQESAIMFGSPSKDHYTGDIEWVGVSKEVYWELKLKDILYGDQALGMCPDGPCKIVVDTGTSLLTGPSADVSKLVDAIGMGYSCQDLSRFVSFTRPVLSALCNNHTCTTTIYKHMIVSFVVTPFFIVFLLYVPCIVAAAASASVGRTNSNTHSQQYHRFIINTSS